MLICRQVGLSLGSSAPEAQGRVINEDFPSLPILTASGFRTKSTVLVCSGCRNKVP